MSTDPKDISISPDKLVSALSPSPGLMALVQLSEQVDDGKQCVELPERALDDLEIDINPSDYDAPINGYGEITDKSRRKALEQLNLLPKIIIHNHEMVLNAGRAAMKEELDAGVGEADERLLGAARKHWVADAWIEVALSLRALDDLVSRTSRWEACRIQWFLDDIQDWKNLIAPLTKALYRASDTQRDASIPGRQAWISRLALRAAKQDPSIDLHTHAMASWLREGKNNFLPLLETAGFSIDPTQVDLFECVNLLVPKTGNKIIDQLQIKSFLDKHFDQVAKMGASIVGQPQKDDDGKTRYTIRQSRGPNGLANLVDSLREPQDRAEYRAKIEHLCMDTSTPKASSSRRLSARL